MRPTARGRHVGLPKEIVAVALGVALVVTAAVDVAGAPGTAPSGPVAAISAPVVPRTPGPGSTTSSSAPSSTTTTAVAVPPSTAAPPAPVRAALRPPPTVPSPAPRPARPAAPPVPPAASRTAQTIGFGAYVGSGDPADLANFAAATGTHPGYGSDYLPRNAGWTGMTDAGSLSWLLDAWRGTGHVLVLGVPMIPTDSGGNPQGTLAGGASGAYNGWFVTLANTLVSSGEPNAVLRIGWEFNGSWYPWSVTDATDAANFVAYFRQIVDAMRSAPGQAFRFVWNPNAGGSYGDAYNPEQTYPGSAYVDYIGTDLYDQCWTSPVTPQNAWASQLVGAWGLDWLANFASAQGRPLAFPEWGVSIRNDGHGMGDDPYFVQQFAQWIVAHDVAWTSYFNFDASDGAHDLFDGNFPQTLSVFRTVFG
jgi:hypothetical protein